MQNNSKLKVVFLTLLILLIIVVIFTTNKSQLSPSPISNPTNNLSSTFKKQIILDSLVVGYPDDFEIEILPPETSAVAVKIFNPLNKEKEVINISGAGSNIGNCYKKDAKSSSDIVMPALDGASAEIGFISMYTQPLSQVVYGDMPVTTFDTSRCTIIKNITISTPISNQKLSENFTKKFEEIIKSIKSKNNGESLINQKEILKQDLNFLKTLSSLKGKEITQDQFISLTKDKVLSPIKLGEFLNEGVEAKNINNYGEGRVRREKECLVFKSQSNELKLCNTVGNVDGKGDQYFYLTKAILNFYLITESGYEYESRFFVNKDNLKKSHFTFNSYSLSPDNRKIFIWDNDPYSSDFSYEIVDTSNLFSESEEDRYWGNWSSGWKIKDIYWGEGTKFFTFRAVKTGHSGYDELKDERYGFVAF